MKKFLSMALVAMMLLGVFCIPAFAEDTQPAADATVYVTISDGEGKLVLTQEAITVTDKDGDGTITVDEALFATHEAKFEGGAEAGYGSAYTPYGLSMTKLWGDASGSFGYYVNNASAWSLADTVQDGDYVNAFVYTDFTAWSDTYCWFDINTANATVGDAVTLTLSYYAYDADWNTVVTPVAGAAITLDGVATEYKTDAEGKVTITLDKAGDVVISATSDTQTLVPPVCKVSVSEKELDSTPDDNTAETPTETDTEKSEKTGCGGVVGVGSIAVVLAGIATVAVFKRKED